MSYIILRDSFGQGLQTISKIGLIEIDGRQLEDYICDAAEAIVEEDDQYASVSDYEEDGNAPMSETLVICEVLDTIGNCKVSNVIKDALYNRKNQKEQEEYELYLTLKEKFEG